MKLSSETVQRFIPALIFFPLLFLASRDLGQVNWLIFGLMTFGAFVYLYGQGKRFRELFFYANIRDDSWLSKLRHSYVLVAFIAAFLSLLLAGSVYLFLIAVHWLVLVAVLGCQLLFPFIWKYFFFKLSPHLKEHSKLSLSNFLTVAFLGLLTCLVLVVARAVELWFFVDTATLRSSDLMADHVIARIEHSFALLQHLARTLYMFELHVLRARLLTEGWLSGVMLVYFLLPSSVVAFSLPVIYGGFSFLTKSPERKAFAPSANISVMLLFLAGVALVNPSPIQAAPPSAAAPPAPSGLESEGLGGLFAWMKYKRLYDGYVAATAELASRNQQLQREVADLQAQILLIEARAAHRLTLLEMEREAWMRLYQAADGGETSDSGLNLPAAGLVLPLYDASTGGPERAVPWWEKLRPAYWQPKVELAMAVYHSAKAVNETLQAVRQEMEGRLLSLSSTQDRVSDLLNWELKSWARLYE